MQVACPSCAAEYPVNERRLPATGLKMRCPKCGSRFHVHADGRTEASEPAAAAPPPTKPGIPRPGGVAIPKPPSGAFDDLDLDLPVAKPPAAKVVPRPPPSISDELDLDLPVAKPPAAKVVPKPPPSISDELDLDLPMPKPPPPAKPSAIADELDLDLPMPRGAAPAPSLGDDFELDLPAPKTPARPDTAAKRPIAPPIDAPSELGHDFDLDLPAPKAARKPIAPPVDLDLDLPAPKSAAKKPIAPPVPDLDLDLPAPKAAARKPIAPPVDDLDFDLPAPKAAAGAKPSPSHDLDLPAPKSASKHFARPTDDLDLDLPAPKQAASSPRAAASAGSREVSDFDLDLPAPRGAALAAGAAFGSDLDADLPALHGSPRSDFDLDLPAPRGEIDLLAPKPARPALADAGRTPFDDLDLPAPRGQADLPVAKSVLERADEAFGDLDLPMPKSSSMDSGFGDLDLPLPKSDTDLPRPRRPGPSSEMDALGDLELPTPHSVADYPIPSGELGSYGSSGEFGELELPEPRSMPAPEPTSDAKPAARAGAGGTAFGELDLGEGAADDMEFADIPQHEESATATATAPLPPRPAALKSAAPRTPKAPGKSRTPWIASGLVLVALLAGAGLHFTPYGIFGIYFLEGFMPGAGDPGQVRAAIQQAETQAAPDGWTDLRQSLSTLSRARRNAGLNRELLARSLVHESLYQLRFGNDWNSAPRASAIRSRLEERDADAPEVALAFAADALRAGSSGGARSRVAQARRHAPADPYVDLVAGELELVDGETEEALAAFQRAFEHGAGARALWGVARTRLAGEDRAAVREAVDAVLEENPRHGEALVVRAELVLEAGDLDGALSQAERIVGSQPVDGDRLRVARSVRARAWSVAGRVHELRGRRTRALQAYDRALAALGSHVPALLGAGRVLLEDRPAEAQARFDSVLQATSAATLVLSSGRTAAQEAQLGAARAFLELDRAQDASAALTQLAAARPEDAEVLLWLAHAERRVDPPENEAAEQHYRGAITAAPEEFPAYLGLAQLFLETDRGADAGAVLEQATARVAESAELRLALGTFEVHRNELPAAVRELRRALALDPDLPAAHFWLGVAQRRAGDLDAAARTFEHLAQLDPSHPRLALERGLLFEARGESARAVESYQAALRETPDDMDLLLRLGAAQVGAGQIDEAESTLERVRQARPSSADAAHFVGRVAFARGRYSDALSQFREAVRLDRTRGEFHLYVGWAALENNQLGEALGASNAAIERDPSLGEAYWVRAVVRLRSGNPAAALTDLESALRLRPNLHQAHATMGEAHEQLNQLQEAVAAYERAVARVDDRGQWWYRLGRLRMDRNDRRGSAQALSRATLLGEAGTPLPGWLAAAHRLYGDALRLDGQRAEAITHYRRYLALAPAGDIDRNDVRQILSNFGVSPD